MGVTICYRPIAPTEGYGVRSYAPSALLTALEKTFGALPIRLTLKHRPALEAMAAVYNSDPNPYEDLIRAIDQYEHLKVYVEQ